MSAVDIDTIAALPLVYLATPYTDYADGLDHACATASAIVARLIALGVMTFSPIAHSHTIARYSNGALNPKDHALWLRHCEPFMCAASALAVAQMKGWQESKGILHEIKFFAEQRKPVFYLDIVNTRFATAAWEID